MIQQDCPICYEKLENNINISISICQHKFHTNCLLLCGSTCPICRTNLIQNTNRNTTKLPQGIYTHHEYKKLIQDHSISYDSLSYQTKCWLEDCEEYDASMAELNKERENKNKERLKKLDPNKYKLFYSTF